MAAVSSTLSAGSEFCRSSMKFPDHVERFSTSALHVGARFSHVFDLFVNVTRRLGLPRRPARPPSRLWATRSSRRLGIVSRTSVPAQRAPNYVLGGCLRSPRVEKDLQDLGAGTARATAWPQSYGEHYISRPAACCCSLARKSAARDCVCDRCEPRKVPPREVNVSWPSLDSAVVGSSLLFLACEGSVPPRGLLAGGVLGRRVRARSPVLTARHSRRCAPHPSFCCCVHPAHRLYDLPPP